MVFGKSTDVSFTKFTVGRPDESLSGYFAEGCVGFKYRSVGESFGEFSGETLEDPW